jgi:hypothetical protein
MRALVPLGSLRGSIFGGGKITSTLRASPATASTPAAKASSAAAIATTVAAAIIAAVISTVGATLGARIFLRGIELAKILRSRGIRFWLTLFWFGRGRAIFVGLAVAVVFHFSGGVVFVLVREVRVHRLFERDGLLRGVIGTQRSGLIGTVRVGERLTGQGFD